MPIIKKVLILCTGNSCRSQMAEGILRHYAKGKLEVASAGTHPSRVHPIAIQVMKEIGIDISHHRSKSVEEFRKAKLDVVITVCDRAKENCPIFLNAPKQFHWSFPDPFQDEHKPEKLVESFRKVRDRIHEKFRQASKTLTSKPGQIPGRRKK